MILQHIISSVNKNIKFVFKIFIQYKQKDKAGLPWYKRFIAGNLLLNFLTVPDFIAYNYLTAPRTRTLSLIRKVWHAPCVAWTVRDESKEPLALARFDAVIFERYRPATYITPPIA